MNRDEAYRQYAEALANPNVQALLNTIAQYEGADYNVAFTGATFQLRPGMGHPDNIRCSGSLCSDAAGRYQFMSDTWGDFADPYGLDFGNPRDQDLAAIILLDKKQGILGDVMRGDLNDRVMNRLSCEWASIPPDACNYSQGGGHPNSTIEEFKSKFAANNGRPLPSGPNQFDSIASTAAAVSPSSGGSIGGAQRRNCPEWDRTMSQGKILTGCNMAGALGLGGSTSIAPGASQGVPGAAASTDLVNVPIDVANLQGKLLWPIRNSSGGKLGVKTSDYTANRRGRPHCGVDLASPPPGGYIVAAAPGTVVYAGPQTGRYQGVGFTGYGNVVLIEHDRPTGKIWTLYAHLASVGTSAGAEVQAGTGIGREGNTGVGTGIHLHFEVRLRVSGQWGGVTNPWPLLDLNK